MESRVFPQVYLQFEGKKVFDGKRKQYWVQDATEDLFPEIEDNLMNHFIGDEPATKYMKTLDDPQGLNDFHAMWKNVLQEKLTIVCLTKDEESNTKLAGFNMLTLCKATDKEDLPFTGETSKRLFNIFKYAESQRNFYEEFNLKTCIKAMGLYVLQDYRGEGLGERILEAREYICRSLGITATITAFTSIISQKLAYKVGFKDFVTLEYEKLGEINEDFVIPDIHNHSKYLKFLYKLYN